MLPVRVWALLALYFVASLTHFAHNAEFIAFYPNMPAWVTREDVYLVWLANTCVGAIGVALSLASWRTLGALGLLAYGLLGLDGLGHYALALCSEHSLAANATIWFEVIAGVALALVCAAYIPKVLGFRSAKPASAPQSANQ